MLNWMYWLVLVTHTVECKAAGQALPLLTAVGQCFFSGLILVLLPPLSVPLNRGIVLYNRIQCLMGSNLTRDYYFLS